MKKLFSVIALVLSFMIFVPAHVRADSDDDSSDWSDWSDDSEDDDDSDDDSDDDDSDDDDDDWADDYPDWVGWFDNVDDEDEEDDDGPISEEEAAALLEAASAYNDFLDVPNGDGGFDHITIDDVYDEEGNFIYEYTGPGDKEENEAIIAASFPSPKGSSSDAPGSELLSQLIEANKALEEARGRGENLSTIWDLEDKVRSYEKILDDYCERMGFKSELNESKTAGVITNKEGKTISFAGDPVLIATGEYIIEDTDLSVTGRKASFSVERHYSSWDASKNNYGSGFFGRGWSTNLETRIIRGHSDLYSNEIAAWEEYLSVLADYEKEISSYADEDSDCRPVLDDMLGLLSEKDAEFSVLRELSCVNEKQKELNRYVEYAYPGELASCIDHDTVIYVQDNGSVIVFRKNEFGSFEPASPFKKCRVELSVLDDGYSVYYPVTGERRYYSEMGLPTSFTFRNGGSVQFFYDSEMRISSVLVDGKKISFAWNGRNLEAVRDESSALGFSYSYAEGKLSAVTDSDGDTRGFEYNQDGLLSKQIKADSSYLTFAYELFGDEFLVVRTTDEEGKSEYFSYDVAGRKTTYTDHDGIVSVFDYDSFGRVVSARFQDGENVSYQYDENGFLKAKSSSAESVSFAYDSSGNMTEKIYQDGTSDRWEYSDGKIMSFTDRDGNSIRYVYDSAMRITEVFCGTEELLHLEYDSDSNISSVTDCHGKRTWYEYDDSNNVTLKTIIDGESGKISGSESWKYDSAGRLVSHKDMLGRESTVSYEEHKMRLNMSGGLEITEEYSPRKLLLKRTEKDLLTGECRVHSYEYDKARRCVAEYVSGIDFEGNSCDKICVQSVEYSDSGRAEKNFLFGSQFEPDTEKSPAMNTIREYSSKQTAQPDKNALRAYDLSGRLISEVLKNASGETIKEDGWIYEDRKITHISAKKYKEEFLLNAFSEVVAYIDGLGNQTCYERDILGRIKCVKNPYGEKVFYLYDENSRLEKVLFPDGTFFRYEYDSASNCMSLSDGAGLVWKKSYNKAGNMTNFSERPFWTLFEYEYDDSQNITAMRQNGQLIARYDYSADGKTIVRTDSEGNGFSYSCDGFGRVVSFRNSIGDKCELGYDSEGKLVSQRDFNGFLKTFSYNGASYSVKGSGEKPFSYVYDAAGNLTEASCGAEKLFFCYDASGALIRQDEGNKDSEILYSYDDARNLVGIKSKNRAITYTYGKNGEIVEMTDSFSSSGSAVNVRVRFVYDRCGRETLRVYDSGESVRTFYDKFGRKILTAGYSSDLSPVFVEGTVFSKKGEVCCSLDSRFLVTSYQYDDFGRIKKVSYPYSDSLERKMRREVGDAGLYCLDSYSSYERASFDDETYDSLQKLCSMISFGALQVSGGDCVISESYEYDARGNMIKKTNPYGVISYNYDSENRLVSWGNSGRISYDANGNMISRKSTYTEMKCDVSPENRIERLFVRDLLDGSEFVREYEYDALGRRCASWKSESGMRRNSYLGGGMFIFSSRNDFSRRVTEPSSDYARSRDGKAQKKSSERYVFIDDNDAASEYKRTNSTKFTPDSYPLYDPRGNVLSCFSEGVSYGAEKSVLMTDSAGSLCSEIGFGGLSKNFDYDLHGEPLSDSPEFGFAGKNFDSASRLYDFGFRNYEPSFARFCSVDPIRDGINWYAYCDGNPVSFFDENGLYAVTMKEQYMQDMGNVPLGATSVNIITGVNSNGVSYQIDKTVYASKEGCLVTAAAEIISALSGVPVTNDFINNCKSNFNGEYISWQGLNKNFGLEKHNVYTSGEKLSELSKAEKMYDLLYSDFIGPQQKVDMKSNGFRPYSVERVDSLMTSRNLSEIRCAETIRSMQYMDKPCAVIAQVAYSSHNGEYSLHFVGLTNDVRTIDGKLAVAITPTSKFDTAGSLGNNRKGVGWTVLDGKVYVPLDKINRMDTVAKNH